MKNFIILTTFQIAVNVIGLPIYHSTGIFSGGKYRVFTINTNKFTR